MLIEFRLRGGGSALRAVKAGASREPKLLCKTLAEPDGSGVDLKRRGCR
jgi:hypothetical protein